MGVISGVLRKPVGRVLLDRTGPSDRGVMLCYVSPPRTLAIIM